MNRPYRDGSGARPTHLSSPSLCTLDGEPAVSEQSLSRVSGQILMARQHLPMGPAPAPPGQPRHGNQASRRAAGHRHCRWRRLNASAGQGPPGHTCPGSSAPSLDKPSSAPAVALRRGRSPGEPSRHGAPWHLSRGLGRDPEEASLARGSSNVPEGSCQNRFTRPQTDLSHPVDHVRRLSLREDLQVPWSRRSNGLALRREP